MGISCDWILLHNIVPVSDKISNDMIRAQSEVNLTPYISCLCVVIISLFLFLTYCVPYERVLLYLKRILRFS